MQKICAIESGSFQTWISRKRKGAFS